MLEYGCEALTVRTRQPQKRVFDGGPMTRVVRFHCLTSQGGGSFGCFSSYFLISCAKTAWPLSREESSPMKAAFPVCEATGRLNLLAASRTLRRNELSISIM